MNDGDEPFYSALKSKLTETPSPLLQKRISNLIASEGRKTPSWFYSWTKFAAAASVLLAVWFLKTPHHDPKVVNAILENEAMLSNLEFLVDLDETDLSVEELDELIGETDG